MYSLLQLIKISLWFKVTQCTIDGLSYMDPIVQRPKDGQPRFDPCNPLYWYPRQIPEYCYYRPTAQPPMIPPIPLPLPVPVPVPQPAPPIPLPIPIPAPIPAPAPVMPPLISPQPIPIIAPWNPIMPMSGLPPPVMPPFYGAYQPPQAGLVPGIPGIVSRDGGINIMPFSDVYSDLLEKHANKLTRRKIRKLLKRYREYPRSRYAKELIKYSGRLRGI